MIGEDMMRKRGKREEGEVDLKSSEEEGEVAVRRGGEEVKRGE